MDKLFEINTLPTIIAGPCSAETETQMQETVEALSKDPRIGMIRCGVWKPRTRPGGFEGLGSKALQWISDIKKSYPQLKFCCEVARPGHVELCLKYGINAVWIGARTSVNPFLVGELAAALHGTDMAVMVKNPITPDVNLWIGAVERMLNAGIEDIAAVHRGFTTYNSIGFRNNPLWELPIEFKRRMPEVPLFCDPSHIAGRSEPIAALCQTALDLHFDGLMIEAHCHPDMALTDSTQQITPEELSCLLDRLVLRRQKEYTPGDLLRLRDQLEAIDAQLLELLSRRMDISRSIGEIKRAHNMPLFQPERWQQVLQKQIDTGRSLGLDEDFVKEISEKIHRESLRQQE